MTRWGDTAILRAAPHPYAADAPELASFLEERGVLLTALVMVRRDLVPGHLEKAGAEAREGALFVAASITLEEALVAIRQRPPDEVLLDSGRRNCLWECDPRYWPTD